MNIYNYYDCLSLYAGTESMLSLRTENMRTVDSLRTVVTRINMSFESNVCRTDTVFGLEDDNSKDSSTKKVGFIKKFVEKIKNVIKKVISFILEKISFLARLFDRSASHISKLEYPFAYLGSDGTVYKAERYKEIMDRLQENEQINLIRYVSGLIEIFSGDDGVEGLTDNLSIFDNYMNTLDGIELGEKRPENLNKYTNATLYLLYLYEKDADGSKQIFLSDKEKKRNSDDFEEIIVKKNLIDTNKLKKFFFKCVERTEYSTGFELSKFYDTYCTKKSTELGDKVKTLVRALNSKVPKKYNVVRRKSDKFLSSMIRKISLLQLEPFTLKVDAEFLNSCALMERMLGGTYNMGMKCIVTVSNIFSKKISKNFKFSKDYIKNKRKL